MSYEAVYLYNSRNEFIGAAIKKADVPKLHSVNVWTSTDEDKADFKRTLEGLNDEQGLREHWPAAHDREVGELVNDPKWEPLELHEEDVPDWENSTIVDDEETGGIDYEKSNIVFRRAMVPDPTEAQNRYFKAQEHVARRKLQRALAASE